jgi:hypothetical protein
VTSTRRDVVLAAALTSIKRSRVECFLRTLRTTGTRARVILFLDAPDTRTPEWLRFFTACDIEPYYVNTSSSVLLEVPKMSRYYFYYQWLKDHLSEVDRILHTDTFDVIFQSDPFIPSLNASRLYFTFEPVSISASRWTASWISDCYGQSFFAKHGDGPVSCSGVTAGGGEPFFRYLKVLLKAKEWRKCFGHSLDQAHHNYLLYTGKFAKVGLEIDSFDCNSRFLTMHFCCKLAKCHWDNKTDIIYGNNTEVAPVLVHQYNRWKNLTRRNNVFCSREGFNTTQSAPMAKLAELSPIEWEMKLPKEARW